MTTSVTTSDNEWQQMTMSDSEWQKGVQWVKTAQYTSKNGWLQYKNRYTTSRDGWPILEWLNK